jgi:hypothetical protein
MDRIDEGEGLPCCICGRGVVHRPAALVVHWLEEHAEPTELPAHAECVLQDAAVAGGS